MPRSRGGITGIRRREASRKFNLSSNELLHPGTGVVTAAFAGAFTAELVSRYPVTADIAREVAGYLGCDEREVVLTPGTDFVIRSITTAHALRTGGRGRVILQDPNYAAWEEASHRSGLALHRVRHDLDRPGSQAERLVAAAAATTGSVIAVSVPGAPVGGWLSPADLDVLAALAADRGHLLVIDACYQVFHGELTEQLRRHGRSVLVVQSLSKSHALAGARVGLVAGDPAVLHDYGVDLLEQCVAGPSLLATRLAIEHHEHLAAVWADIRRVRGWAGAELRAMGLIPWPSGGNFLAFDTGAGSAAARITEALSERGYRIRDLSALPGYSGHLRFTVPDEPTCRRFFEVLRTVLIPEMRKG